MDIAVLKILNIPGNLKFKLIISRLSDPRVTLRLWSKPNLLATATRGVTQHLLEADLLHGHLPRLAHPPHLILQVQNQAQVRTGDLNNGLFLN